MDMVTHARIIVCTSFSTKTKTTKYPPTTARHLREDESRTPSLAAKLNQVHSCNLRHSESKYDDI